MIALAAASDVLIPDLTTISRFKPGQRGARGAQAFGLNLRECPRDAARSVRYTILGCGLALPRAIAVNEF
jgi:hypothetical protein